MTKIEIIQQVIEKKEKAKDAVCEKEKALVDQRMEAKKVMLMQYFGDCLEEEDVLEVSGSYIYFKRPHKDYSYLKEVLTLEMRSKSWRDDEIDSIRTSFYSTNENSDFELRRMVLLGKVGQVILDFKDDIIAEYNNVIDKFKISMSKVSKERYNLSKEIDEHYREVTAIKRAKLYKKVRTEGLVFGYEENKLRGLPSLDIRFNHEVRFIRSIKIVGETKSGKSVDIEVETLRDQYDYETGESSIVSAGFRTYQKVRYDKVQSLIDWNEEKVLEDTPTLVGA